MINGFGCYLKYLAIKSHFINEKYDYFKYQGQVKADIKSFYKRNDKYYFAKLAKLLKTEDEMERFFVANFTNQAKLWIGEALDDNSAEIYLKWKKKLESISYKFKQDLLQIKPAIRTLPEMFEALDGQHPPVLKMFLKKDIMLETLVILDSFVPFFEDWNEQIKENIIWPEIYKRARKYQPFLESYLGKQIYRRLKAVTKQILVD